jgi:hypothetical protein
MVSLAASGVGSQSGNLGSSHVSSIPSAAHAVNSVATISSFSSLHHIADLPFERYALDMRRLAIGAALALTATLLGVVVRDIALRGEQPSYPSVRDACGGLKPDPLQLRPAD